MHSDLLETRLLGERMRRLPQEHEPPLSWEQFQQTRRAAKAASTPAAVVARDAATNAQSSAAVTRAQHAAANARADCAGVAISPGRGAAIAHACRRARKLRSRWAQVAIAASACATVVALALWGRASLLQVDDAGEPTTAQAELPMLAQPDRQYLAQAEISERWLSRLPIEPAVMRVGTRTAVADLEDRIAWMDDVLSAERLDAVDHAHIVALQRERARLVNSLAQVRYAETLVAAAQ
jgi:hypothetical protein